jgi:hypothetical protein
MVAIKRITIIMRITIIGLISVIKVLSGAIDIMSLVIIFGRYRFSGIMVICAP